MPHAFSNWDDTAVALGSLSALTDGDLDEQIDFLRRVQNRDGSWSAYTTDFAPQSSTEIADEARLTIGDEQYQLRFGYIPAPDITGNALSTLGMQGDTVDDDRHIDDAVSPSARESGGQRAVARRPGAGLHLRHRPCDGGLRAVDVDMDDDFVTAARGTLLSRQNDDGGWGEQTRYDPSQPESGSIEYQPGESTPIQTGWALQALLLWWHRPRSGGGLGRRRLPARNTAVRRLVGGRSRAVHLRRPGVQHRSDHTGRSPQSTRSVRVDHRLDDPDNRRFPLL